jgi:hypothetical protein
MENNINPYPNPNISDKPFVENMGNLIEFNYKPFELSEKGYVKDTVDDLIYVNNKYYRPSEGLKMLFSEKKYNYGHRDFKDRMFPYMKFLDYNGNIDPKEMRTYTDLQMNREYGEILDKSKTIQHDKNKYQYFKFEQRVPGLKTPPRDQPVTLTGVWVLYEKSPSNRDILEDSRGDKDFYSRLAKVKIPRDWIKVTYHRQRHILAEPAQFFHKGLQKIAENQEYKSLALRRGNVRFQDVALEVWIYIRSMNKIYDVTKFISNLSMNCQKQNSTFEFDLQHINKFDDENITVFKPETRVMSSVFDAKYNTDNTDFSLNTWSKVLNINDIVWIKLEQLGLEKERKKDFVVPNSELEGKFYDMIGLIDTVQENRNKHGKLQSIIKVQGRDLCKLFIDDHAYFHPLAIVKTVNKELTITSQSNRSNTGSTPRLIGRNFITGNYDLIFGKTQQQIYDLFDFWLLMLSNMGILPEEENATFFQSYDLRGKEIDREVFDSSTGKWVYGNIDRRNKLYDITDDPGTGKITKTVRTITKKVNKKDIEEEVLQLGLYQIIQLYADSSIEKRGVVDASVGNPKGPFLQLFNKICQFPFVEVILDTYIDEYCIIVRQPPFTEELVKEYLKHYLVEKDENIVESTCIAIEDLSVKSIDLSFSQEIYTWFQLDPKGNYFGNSQGIALSYAPIVQFDEYVNRWGSKQCYVCTNYMDRRFWDDNYEKDPSFKDMKASVVEDLVQLVETYAYVPFTRTGRIILGHSERRIKKGLFVHLKYTDEIFYVDAVQHNVSKSLMNSETIITVSRGMKREYIKGKTVKIKKNGKEQKLIRSYFNIFQKETLSKALNELWTTGKMEGMEGAELINMDNFNFFIEKKQFN